MCFLCCALADDSQVSGQVASFPSPRSVAITGIYASSYRDLITKLGAEVSEVQVQELTRADVLKRFDLVILAHLEGEAPAAVDAALYDYARQGGKVYFELASFPSRKWWKGTYVAGWAPHLRITQPGHPLFASLRPKTPELRYGMWGAGAVDVSGEGVEVLARWFVSPQGEYPNPVYPAFGQQPAAVVYATIGKGTAVLGGGAFVLDPATAPLDRSIVAHLLGERKLPLLQLEPMLETPVEVVQDASRLSSRVVGIFNEEDFPASGMPKAATPQFIAETLRGSGRATVFLDAQELSSSAALNPHRINTLVLTCGETFPVYALANLKRFLAGGGGLVCPAGVPLSHLCIKEEGRWRDLAKGKEDTLKAFIYCVFRDLLPIGKYYTASRPPALTLCLSNDFLPHMPAVWQLKGGTVGLVHQTTGSQHMAKPLLASVSAEGEVVSVPLSFSLRNPSYPCARIVCLGFVGESHPWNPRAWSLGSARQAIVSTVELGLRRSYVAIEDLMANAPCYLAGETVELKARVVGATETGAQVHLTIRERDTGHPRHRENRFLTLRGGEPRELTFTWALPVPASWAYDAVLLVKPVNAPPVSELTMLCVRDDVLAQRARPFGVSPDGYALHGGKPTWLTGFNLYTNDSRGIGAYFDAAQVLGKHPLPEIWDRDLSLLNILGGNAVRQHYYEHILKPDSFSKPGFPWEVRVLEANHLLLSYHDVVEFADPFTFSPAYYWHGRKELPELGQGDPYTDPQWLSQERTYLTGLALHCARYPNIAWEIINEPEDYGSKAKTVEERANLSGRIANWCQMVSDLLKLSGREHVGIGQAFSTLSPLWSLRSNLRFLSWSNVHCYVENLTPPDGRWNTPLGLNYGRPCLIGEAGKENPRGMQSALLQEWESWYERLLHFAIGERALGFTNFYLNNSLQDVNAPEWGLMRHDMTEKESCRTWKRWNFLLRRLPRDAYLDPSLWMVLDSEQLLEKPRLLDEVARQYLSLLEIGLPSLVVTEHDLSKLDPQLAPQLLLIPGGSAPRSAVWDLVKRRCDAGAKCVILERQPSRDRVPFGPGADTRAIDERKRTEGKPDWVGTQLPDAETLLPPGFVLLKKPARFVYPLRKKNGGLTIVCVEGNDEAGEMAFRGHTVRFTIPKGRCAIVDLLADGAPRLVEAYGEVRVDNRVIVDASEKSGYVLCSVGHGSLLDAATVELWGDDPAAVAPDKPVVNSVQRLKGLTLLAPPRYESAARQLATALSGAGVRRIERPKWRTLRRLPRGNLLLLGTASDNRFLKQVLDGFTKAKAVPQEGFPYLFIGKARLWQPWSGLILTLERPKGGGMAVVVTGVTEGGVLTAAQKLTVLRSLGNYTVGPFAEVGQLVK